MAPTARTASAARPGSRGRLSSRLYRANEGHVLGLLSVALLLGLWEVAVAAGRLNPIFLSSPSRIAAQLVVLVTSGEFYDNLRVSAVEFGIGLAFAVAIGIPVGYAAALWRRAGYVLEPLLAALYATPTIALIPLMIIWFGIGMTDKIIIVFLGAFLQIAISTLGGLRLVNANLLRVARSFNASGWYVFRTILVPSSVPFLLIGLRLGISRGLVAVITAEFVAATAGIGFMITVAGSHFQTATVFVGIIFIALLGVAGSSLVGVLEHRVERWRPKVGSA